MPVQHGLVRGGLAEALAVEAEVVQLFLGNPRSWKSNHFDLGEAHAFRAQVEALCMPVFVHASHLINLCSPNLTVFERSVLATQKTMRRAARVGARGVVLHAGSYVEPGFRDEALTRLAHAVESVVSFGIGVDLLIEPTAGGGRAMAYSVDTTVDFMAALESAQGRERVGLCLDTCHLHAAGEDVTTASGLRQIVQQIRDDVGPDAIRPVHVNDSKDPRGSRRDRHESVRSSDHWVHTVVGAACLWMLLRGFMRGLTFSMASWATPIAWGTVVTAVGGITRHTGLVALRRFQIGSYVVLVALVVYARPRTLWALIKRKLPADMAAVPKTPVSSGLTNPRRVRQISGIQEETL